MQQYINLQYAQLTANFALLGLVLVFCRWKNQPLGRALSALVVIGYGIACAASNLLRAITNDLVVLSQLTDEEYLVGSVWWIGSECAFVLMYLVTIGCRNYRTRNLAAAFPVQVYIILSGVLLLCYFLNPFRTTDYGVFSAIDVLDLQVGGLLISGLIAVLVSGLAAAIFAFRPWAGSIPVAFAMWMLIQTGSKAIGAVYLIIIAYQRRLVERDSRSAANSIGAVRTLISFVVFFCAVAGILSYSVGKRFGGGSVSLPAAGASAVGRFTQQEVAALIFARDEWRENFRPRYVQDTILSIVPGFIWRNKPVNPAYEINDLLGRSFTAASPSFFGAELIITGLYWYWPALAFVALALGVQDAMFLGTAGTGKAEHFYWYYFYTFAMLFEGNFVIWLVQLAILYLWRALLADTQTRSVFGAEIAGSESLPHYRS